MRLVLAVNVAIGVSDVDLAKLREELDAGAIGGPEFGTAELPVTNVAGKDRPIQVVGGMFERVQERTVGWRHIVPHFLEVDREWVWSMNDAESCIEGRYNRALCAGFTAELLRLSGVGCDALIH